MVAAATYINSPFLAKMYAVGTTNNIEILMLVLDFVVNFKLKNTQWNFIKCLNRDVQKRERKNNTFMQWGYRDDQIATQTNLLNIKYEFYGFSDL